MFVASHFKVIESEAEYEAALEAGLLYTNTSGAYPRKQQWETLDSRWWNREKQWSDFPYLCEDEKASYCKEDLAVLVECDTD